MFSKTASNIYRQLS